MQVARLVEEPAVVGAAQPALVRNPVLQVDAPVQAAIADQAERAAAVAIEDEVLAEEAHLADRILQELRERPIGIQ